MRHSLLIILAFISSFILSCEKDKGPLIIKPPPVPGDTMLHFSRDIQPVFNEHCITCHNQYHVFLDLREDNSWIDLWFRNPHGANAPYLDSVNPENSQLIQHLRGVQLAIMPPNAPPLPPTTIDTIAKWMSQGGRDN